MTLTKGLVLRENQKRKFLSLRISKQFVCCRVRKGPTMEYNLQNNRIDSGDFSIDSRLHLSTNFSSDMKESRGFSMDSKDSRGFSMDCKDSRSFSMDCKDSRSFSMDCKDSRSFSMDSKDSRSFSMDTKDSRSFSMDTKDSRSFSMDTRDSRSFSTDSKVASRGFSMDTKESNGFAAERTPEEVVNSIKITEGPVTHMSMAVQKTSRTPYSDATQVSVHASIRIDLAVAAVFSCG